MATFTVTATEAGSTASGIAMFLAVVTGQAVSQSGAATLGATNTTPNNTITPNATGSWIYGSVLGISATFTVVSGTTNKQDAHNIGGLEMASCRSTGTTTSGTPIQVGYTSTANGISICLAEILNSSGLAEDPSTPAGVSSNAVTTISTASFTPPGGSLLVAMVQSNGGGGVTTMGITDTSGLGLTWTELLRQNVAGDGYTGIWTAPVPSSGVTTITTYQMRRVGH